MDSKGFDGYWTPDQASSLVEGLPDLRKWSESAFVSFSARKLAHCRVLWINRRWFCQRSIDVDDDETCSRLEAWLIQTFGYVTSSSDDAQTDDGAEKILQSDRYGSSSGLFAHGGSGRAATIGHFNVKGIGATPLVGKGVNREHSHGNASLNVAIREAIFGEIFDSEFPHGAVPIIAILDTGLEFSSSANPKKMLRRALIVRPSMIRPAHMQRAPGFIQPIDGHKNKQTEDVKRTKEFISSFLEHALDEDGNCAREALQLHFNRVAEQIAHGHAHRLFSGGFFTSNLTVEGRLLDFGNSYVLANWINASVLDNDLGFGRDLDVLRTSVKSLLFYFSKYKPGHVDPSQEAEFMSQAKTAWSTYFQMELSRLLGMNGHETAQAKAIVNAMTAYFYAQQKHRVNYSKGESSDHGWFWGECAADSLISGHGRSTGILDPMLSLIRSELQKATPNDSDLSRALHHTAITANRHLGPRTSLCREVLQMKVASCIARIKWSDLRGSTSSIGTLISNEIELGRRHWRTFPNDLTILGHMYEDGCTAIEAIDPRTSQLFYWLEGICVEQRARIFRRSANLRALGDALMFHDKRCWRALIPTSSWKERSLRERGIDIDLPDMRVRYDQVKLRGA